MYRLVRTAFIHSSGLIAIVVTLAAIGNLLLLCQPVQRFSPALLAWWTGLCAVSVCNIWLWRRSAEAVAWRKGLVDPEIFVLQRRQLLLAAVYVLGCAFRALLPRADVQRLGLFDTWVSSVLVGRSVATVAELCFAVQWALFLHHFAKQADCRFGIVIARLFVPLIFVAEICSWYGVLTTDYFGNTIEESIWAVAGALLVVGLLLLWRRTPSSVRPAVSVAILLGTAYVAYLCAVDVPMYAGRWLADEANGREYLTLSQGLWDAGSRWNVSHAWEEWYPEISWMTLYFSLGVWCSIGLIHVPRGISSEPRPGVAIPAAV